MSYYRALCNTTNSIEANPDRYTGVWVETFFDTDGKTYAGASATHTTTTHKILPRRRASQ
jgi:hypothetical protein